jgi:hypothetical protein
MRTAGRRLTDALDAHPFPARYRPHGKHYGVPFIPIMGGRGCWGACSYCAITSTLRDARSYGGAKMLRHRSPENVATEMFELTSRAGGRGLFCFHDDNFLMPRPKDSLERVRAIREAFDGLGGGDIAFIGKCRPDSVSPELMRELRKLGVIRLYVGVENASQKGADHLNRRTQQERTDDALRACREAGIFVCYNLLLFEPDATLDDVRENIAFMRRNAHHPVNFCRAEPYVGTPLHEDVAARQELGGSYLGFNYRIEDDDTELLFRVCSAAFRQRNFDPEGVANRNMGLGYSLKILEQFYEDPDGQRKALQRRTEALTRAISMETAGLLERALELVLAHRDAPDALARHAVLLGLEIAEADRARHAQLDALYGDMTRFALEAARRRWWKVPAKRLAKVAQRVALSATLAAATTACDACGGTPPPPDPVPSDWQNNPPPPDPVPSDWQDNPPPNDPVPTDWQETPPPPDPLPPDMMQPVDPPPPDRPIVVDPVPVDPDMRMMPPDPPPPDYQPPSDNRRNVRSHDRRVPQPPIPPPDPLPAPHPKPAGRALELIDQWRETTVKDVMRTTDLPLFDPPRVRLRARWADDGADVVEVELEGGPSAASLRWQGDGRIEGEGRSVRWHPADDDDQIRVAVRTVGGIAITSVRASQVR